MLSFIQLNDYSDDELNNKARLIYFTALGLIILSLLFIIISFFIAPDLMMRAVWMSIVADPTAIAIMALVRCKRIYPAGMILTILIWLIVTVVAIRAGGVSAPILFGYLIVILMGGLVSKRGNSIYATVISTITVIGIAYAETNGILPKPVTYSPYARVIIYIFFFIIAMLMQTINSQNMQRLLKQAKKSELRYKTLLENIPTTTYINNLDSNARTEYVSPQVEKLLGYPRKAFTDDPLLWTKILHPEDMQRVKEESKRTANTREPFNEEYRLITQDKRVIWVKDEATLVRDDEGNPLYWLGVWTDITSRKHAEDEQADLMSAMTRRTVQLQTAAEVSRAASSILNLDKLLPAVVELIRNHFDYYYAGIFLAEEESEWAVLSAATGEMGKLMIGIGHRLKVEDSSMVGWCITHGQARIALDVGEDAVRFVNPHLPLTRSEMALPLITHGKVIGAMTIQSERPGAFSRVDITALQTMADQVANAIENARLYTERVSLNKELKAQNAELERFTYTVSHDLRSPLVTIRGFLGYLQQDAKTGNMSRFDSDLKRIANAVDRMQTLLNELLELSRIGRITNPPENVPFGEIVNEVADLLSGPLEAGNIRLEIMDEFPTVHVDRLRVAEVIQNLIGNSIKFMGRQTTPSIEIGTRGEETDGKPIFYVRDNGIGIEPEYHERIFGLFNRLDPSIEGTGIGLTLVRRIIDIHEGRIWVESEPGKGATFLFTLPVAET